MRNLFFLLLAAVLAIAGLAWPGFLKFFYCKPDLLLIYAVTLMLCADFKTAFILGVCAGLLKDALTPGSFGINTVLFVIWLYLVHRISHQISTKESYVRLAIMLSVALLHNAGLGIAEISTGNIIPAGIFLRNLIVASFYTALVSPLIFKLTDRISA